MLSIFTINLYCFIINEIGAGYSMKIQTCLCTRLSRSLQLLLQAHQYPLENLLSVKRLDNIVFCPYK